MNIFTLVLVKGRVTQTSLTFSDPELRGFFGTAQMILHVKQGKLHFFLSVRTSSWSIKLSVLGNYSLSSGEHIPFIKSNKSARPKE